MAPVLFIPAFGILFAELRSSRRITPGRSHIRVVLQGKKLRGEFALVRMHRGPEKNWLLFKKSDDFATDEDVTTDERSVISKRTLATLPRFFTSPTWAASN